VRSQPPTRPTPSIDERGAAVDDEGVLRWIALLLLAVFAPLRLALALPPGFVEEDIGEAWDEVAGVTFDDNGRVYVWERGGRVWIVENGMKHATPLIDIHDEVGAWRDFGLLGFALHPNFAQNGWIYLYYVVDRHHLLHAGTQSYDPTADEYYDATIGRITRYTALASDGFDSVDPTSRVVLVGATPDDGCPILYESHGTGSLVFGTDETLLAGCGDGASYATRDIGSAPGTYYTPALADGIISATENVGALRAQQVESLSGKIWRIDPVTGAGVPSNPSYQPANPYSKASRVWALGVRNPYRMTLRPGPWSHDPNDGDPGPLYVGDVGWGAWEDLSVVRGGGRNLGWPLFEGMLEQGWYLEDEVENRFAPNPLYDGTTCTRPYFYFSELIQQESLTPNPSFPNPCGGQITTEPTFVHNAPVVDYGNSQGPARSKTFSGDTLVPVTIGAPGSPVDGVSFGGNASTGGVWYTGTAFPAQYQNTYFHADYGAGWIRNMAFDANDQPTRVDFGPLHEAFHDLADGVVHVAAHPSDGSLYYVSWTSIVRRVRWVGLGSEPPIAVAAANLTWGTTPLSVQFTSSGSSDPEGSALTYLWSFGDGATSTQANPVHVFTAPPGVPTAFSVTLTVRDATNLTAVATRTIWVGNTPPQVEVTSPADGSLYSLAAPTIYPLAASFSDAEHSSGQLTCAWQTTLHHNTHSHGEPIDSSCTSSAQISPTACDGSTYYYTVSLTVSDPLGLSASDTVTLVPACVNAAPIAVADAATVARGASVPIGVAANDSDGLGSIDPGSVEIVTPPLHGTTSVHPTTGVVTYAHDGTQPTTDAFSYRISDSDPLVSNVAEVSIAILPDADADGFGDSGDNCPYLPNDQSDAGGLGASGPDRIGDACQCGDLDADGDADTGDRAALRAALADPLGTGAGTLANAHCSVTGSAASCDLLDSVVLARANALFLPRLAQACGVAEP
jgi:glucose/arabinose dehydrogenase